MASELKTNIITKIHFIFSMVTSFLFLIGVALILMPQFRYIDVNLVINYNGIVFLLSLVPVEPALFIANIIVNIVQKRSFKYYILPVIACIVTFVTWLIFAYYSIGNV